MSPTEPHGWSLEHHWVARVEGEGSGGRWRIGLSSFAQAHLGEVVALTLPAPGARLVAGQAYGEAESTITVADLFAPLSGTVAACNTALTGSPELVNADPEREGWLLEVDAETAGEPPDLLSAGGYRRATQGDDEPGARRADDE